MPLSTSLLSQSPIISNQISKASLQTVLGALESVLITGVAGDIVELGCYIGTSTLFFRRLLDALGQSAQRNLYAYDSFVGLPSKASQDQSRAGEQFVSGELSVSKKQFLHEFQKAYLQPPITHKGWFNDLQPHQLPEQIAFAFLDGDFYDSILDSLKLVWPRMSVGGIVTIDDYQREALPGVERAVNDFFGQHLPNLRREHGIAIIKKP